MKEAKICEAYFDDAIIFEISVFTGDRWSAV